MQSRPVHPGHQLGIQGRQVVYRKTTPEPSDDSVQPEGPPIRRASRQNTASRSVQQSRRTASVEESGYPELIVGLPSQEALQFVTRLPDQDSSHLLWILVSLWIGGSSVYIAPKAVLKSVLLGVKKVLNQQLTYPEGWAGLPPELTSPVTAKLCLEFGPREFIRAVLSVSSFYILLHHDSNVVSLFPMLQELEAAYTQWVDALGGHYEFVSWLRPER